MRVLVAATPRSGSSWVGRALGMAVDTVYLHEPDNDMGRPFALRAKRSLGRFPLIDRDESADAYERLWRAAFESEAEGGFQRRVRGLRTRASLAIHRRIPRPQLQAALSSPDGRRPLLVAAAATLAVPTSPDPAAHVVVKSVHAPMALEWIERRFRPAVVVVLRNPLNVVASLLELGLPDRDRRLDADPKVRERVLDPLGIKPPEPGASDVVRTAWQVALLTTVLERTASRNPSFVTVTHEELCIDSRTKFRALCERVGLSWSPAVDHYLTESNRPGTGFSTNRLGADEPQRWRDRLTPGQVEETLRTISEFGFSRWNLGVR